MRCILHVDMDAFYASVEQRDRPELRGRPVVVGSAPDKRGVVSACSYEARAYGIHSAMPSREAYQRCPEAVFIKPDMERYGAASAAVFRVFARFSPVIEPLSIDEAFIDVTGVRRLFGSGEEIGRKLRDAVRQEVGLAASVGVATNKFLAKLGSQHAKPDGLLVMPSEAGEVREYLAGLKVGAIFGVGRVTGAALERAGYFRIRDIQQADITQLERVVGGNMAEHLRALAFGVDCREVEQDVGEKSISREQTFLEDCSDPEKLRETLKALVDDVGQRTRARGYYACVGRIKLRWSDFRTITRQAPFESAVCDDFSMWEMALRLFNAEKLIQPVRLIGFGVSGFCEERTQQLGLFDDLPEQRERRERLCHIVDKLNEKLGPGAVRRG